MTKTKLANGGMWPPLIISSDGWLCDVYPDEFEEWLMRNLAEGCLGDPIDWLEEEEMLGIRYLMGRLTK